MEHSLKNTAKRLTVAYKFGTVKNLRRAALPSISKTVSQELVAVPSHGNVVSFIFETIHTQFLESFHIFTWIMDYTIVFK